MSSKGQDKPAQKPSFARASAAHIISMAVGGGLE